MKSDLIASLVDCMYGKPTAIKKSDLCKFLEDARLLGMTCFDTPGLRALEAKLRAKEREGKAGEQEEGGEDSSEQEECVGGEEEDPVLYNLKRRVGLSIIVKNIPASLNLPDEPTSLNLPLEPASLNLPLEPASLSQPATSHSLQDTINAPTETPQQEEVKNKCCCTCKCNKETQDTSAAEPPPEDKDTFNKESLARKLETLGTTVTGQTTFSNLPSWIFTSNSISILPVQQQPPSLPLPYPNPTRAKPSTTTTTTTTEAPPPPHLHHTAHRNAHLSLPPPQPQRGVKGVVRDGVPGGVMTTAHAHKAPQHRAQGVGGVSPQGVGGVRSQGVGGVRPQGVGGIRPQGVGGIRPLGTYSYVSRGGARMSGPGIRQKSPGNITTLPLMSRNTIQHTPHAHQSTLTPTTIPSELPQEHKAKQGRKVQRKEGCGREDPSQEDMKVVKRERGRPRKCVDQGHPPTILKAGDGVEVLINNSFILQLEDDAAHIYDIAPLGRESSATLPSLQQQETVWTESSAPTQPPQHTQQIQHQHPIETESSTPTQQHPIETESSTPTQQHPIETESSAPTQPPQHIQGLAIDENIDSSSSTGSDVSFYNFDGLILRDTDKEDSGIVLAFQSDPSGSVGQEQLDSEDELPDLFVSIVVLSVFVYFLIIYFLFPFIWCKSLVCGFLEHTKPLRGPPIASSIG